MKNKHFFVFIKGKNGIHCVERDSARNPRFLLIITGWGESGKVILQVSVYVFGALSKKFFGQRWLSPPRKKLARTPLFLP